jgi:hypothetical protein
MPDVGWHVHEVVHRLSLVSVQTMLAVHALLILSGCWLAFSRRRWQTVLAWPAVLAFSLVWLVVNHRWEGRILFGISPNHGVTQADLVVPVVIAAAVVVRTLRLIGRTWHRHRQERISAGVPSAFRVMWPES